MTEKERLIAIAITKYRESQPIKALPGTFRWPNGERVKSDVSYRFNMPKSYDNFYYDSESDTLCNWGRGIGLIYQKGIWAGEENSIETYQIY